MKIIFTRGLQGSGKSTWAKEFCSANPNFIRVSRDDLRNMRGKYWLPKQEDLITHMEEACIYAALDRVYSVIIDSMNLNEDKLRSRVAKYKSEYPEIEIEYKDFRHVPLETCIANDLKRPNSIGEKVIRETYEKNFPREVYTEDPDLPKAIIVDIDGTLAQMEGKRGPYEWNKVGQDEVVPYVREIVRRFANTHTVFIFSGRDSVCRSLTLEWLDKNMIPYNFVKMRPEGNMEKDSIIKERMLDELKGQYYIDFVIDDRLQVCEMWYRKGMNLLKVGNPHANF